MNQNFSDIATNGLSTVLQVNGQSTMSAPLPLANGTVSLPSLTFGTDTNTGIYRNAADTIGIATGGALVAKIDTTGIVAYSADAGAAAGPIITLNRDSASPAASDIIGQVLFTGEDSAGNTQSYAAVQSTITDPTSTSEDGTLDFQTVVAGTVATRANIGSGLWVGSATGTDKGAGTINATAVYDDGVQIFPCFSIAGASGLVIVNNSGTPTTQIDLDAAFALMGDSSNNVYLKATLDVTINGATTGANALDAGALANNTWYHVYAIYNPTTATTAGLISTSATAPTMPTDYTAKVRLGAVKTGGSATFLRTIQKGRIARYQVVAASTTPNLPIVVSGGVVGSISVPTWVSQTVAGASGTTAFVPTTAVQIDLQLSLSSGSAIVAPNNAYGVYTSQTNPPSFGATADDNTQGSILLESTAIFYAASASGNALAVRGWIDNVNA